METLWQSSSGQFDAVVTALRVRDARRARRTEHGVTLGAPAYTEALDELRVRMARARHVLPVRRTSAFSPLSEDELALLERAIAGYEREGRFTDGNTDESCTALLAPLRANFLAGREVLSGEEFRSGARALFALVLERAITAAVPTNGLAQALRAPPPLVFVLPWRAALIAGEVARAFSIAYFWHLGCARDEESPACTSYYEDAPPLPTRSAPHIIAEPMLATGGTLTYVIERLRAGGVAPERMVIACAIAAPEGVDRILHTYPGIRIVAGALDSHLDQKGYIEGPGLGDFGDLAMRGVDSVYARAHWVTPGLLTDEQADIVLKRCER